MRGDGRRSVWTVVLLAGAIGTARAADVDPMLDLGIRQFRDGDLKAAVFSLDSAARRLAAAYADKPEQSRALLFLGAAQIGLGQIDRGRDNLRRALTFTPDLDVSPDHLPGPVLKELESLRHPKSPWTKLPVLLGAAVLGAGAGRGADALILENHSARANQPPAGTVAVFPDGNALAGVTVLSFDASVVDADGDALTYSWRFGDGTVRDGPSAKHTFLNPGTFEVQLTVSDGRGTPTLVTRPVTVRSMDGLWKQDPYYEPYTFLQSGINVETNEVTESPVGSGTRFWKGTLQDPRQIAIRLYHGTRSSNAIGPECVGELDPKLEVISCVSENGLLQIRRQ